MSDAARAEKLSHLFESALNGCPDATQALFDEYRGYFLNAIRRRLRQRVRLAVDSTDILQELRLRIFERNLHDVALSSPAAFIRYVSRMAENLTRNINRKHLQVSKRSLLHQESLEGMDAVEELLARHLGPHEEALINEQIRDFCRRLPNVYGAVLRQTLRGHSSDE